MPSAAYNRPAAQLVELLGEQRGRVHPLGRAPAAIGRDTDAEICIGSADVSRRHAQLEYDTQGWSITDLGSKNGLLVNGCPVQRVRLAEGDHIQLGGSMLLLFTRRFGRPEMRSGAPSLRQTLGTMTSVVAHDLNNMLGALLANIDVLDEKQRTQSLDATLLAECLGDMQQASERATQLVRQLLNVARPDGPRFRDVALSRLLADVAQAYRHSLDRAIRVELRGPPQATVRGDPLQLHQVFMNLVVNARDAMPEGGRLEIVTSALDAGIPADEAAATSAGFWQVAVRDSGIGMDAVTQRQVFQPYFTNKRRGTGLGLSTVDALVRQHGGSIQVDSAPGQGTTFYVYLPMAPSEGLRLGLAEPSPVDAVAPRTARVLLADADPAVLRSTGRLLEARGHTVLVASTGAEALAYCQDGAQKIDIVVLDLRLPDAPGALARLRTQYPELRVLLSSGGLEEQTLASLSISGVHGFVDKPFRLATLCSALQRVLQ